MGNEVKDFRGKMLAYGMHSRPSEMIKVSFNNDAISLMDAAKTHSIKTGISVDEVMDDFFKLFDYERLENILKLSNNQASELHNQVQRIMVQRMEERASFINVLQGKLTKHLDYLEHTTDNIDNRQEKIQTIRGDLEYLKRDTQEIPDSELQRIEGYQQSLIETGTNRTKTESVFMTEINKLINKIVQVKLPSLPSFKSFKSFFSRRKEEGIEMEKPKAIRPE